MSLNSTPNAERVHITFYGQRNAGKSSVVNAITGQQLSITSDVKGTTTDPVHKAMELLPVGPVVITDTPGLDDEGELGLQRIKRALQTLDKTDVAVLVADASRGLQAGDQRLIALFQEKKIPYLTAYNKIDLLDKAPELGEGEICVSALEGTNITELKDRIAALAGTTVQEKHLVADLLNPGDLVVLVTPIDASAPRGRMILPQQQTIRDILDGGAMCVVCKETELAETLTKFKDKPAMVITDSKVFGMVDKLVSQDILLTSFSILFARYKGDLETVVRGAFQLDRLQDGDKVLISEGCTHHRQCGDIGTEKLPAWIRKYTGKQLEFSFTSGGEFPEDVRDYALVVHCGGCMLNEKEMKSRILRAREQKVPITNYGVAIAHLHGMLKRSVSPFPQLLNE